MGNVIQFITNPNNRHFLIQTGVYTISALSFFLMFKPLSRRFALYSESIIQETRRNNRPKRIILIRHGESEANVNGNVYCTTPDNQIPLTKRGVEQANDAGLFLKSYIGDKETIKFYMSPFLRTKQTCDNIKQHFNSQNYKCIEDPRLREQEWGNLQDPSQLKRVEDERDHVGKFYYRFSTGESGADVYDRVTLFLTSFFRAIDRESNTASERCQYDNVVLVTHGLFIRLFLMRYFKWTVSQFEELENPANGGVIILKKNSKGKYETEGQLRKKKIKLSECI